MLNQNDRRRLEEIERQLQTEDPEFVRRFSQWPSPRVGVSRHLPTVVVVVGALAMVLSLLAVLPAVFLLFLVGTAGGYAWLRRRRPGAGPAGANGAGGLGG